MSNHKPYEEIIKAAKPSSPSGLGPLKDHKLGTHWGSNLNKLSDYPPNDSIVWFECAVVAAYLNLIGNSIHNESGIIERGSIKLTLEEEKTLKDFREIGKRIASLAFPSDRGRARQMADLIRQRAAEQGVAFR